MSGSGEGTTPGRAGALRADHPWVTAAVTFVIVLAPFLAWALATPPYASPDENDHVRYAVAVASFTPVEAIPADDGQWSAELFEQLDRRALTPERIAVGWGYARLPAFYGQEGFTCFNFRSNVTAECQQLGPLDGTSELVMSTRLYPKPYYAIVGLPSLVVDNSHTLFAMRAISGALAAAAITFAIMVARRRHRPMLLGIAVALTPMVWFMGASVNPNGTEIALAMAWWVGLVALLDDERVPRTRGLLVGTVVVGAGLAVVRPLSLVWLGLIAIVVMINAGLGPLRRVLADRAVLVGGAIVLVVCAVQTVLVLGNGSLGSTDPRTALAGIETSAALRTSIGRQPKILEEMIGVFGWLDTRVPAAVVVAWLVVLGIVVALALVTGRRRHLIVLAGLGVAAVAVPVALEVQGVSAVGFIWQGRYSLPLAIGVPLLAARAIDIGHGVTITAPAQRRLALAVTATTAVGAGIAFYQALRRYTVGVSGSVLLWDDIRWQPPVPAWSAVVLGVGAHLVMGWWLYMLITHRPPRTTTAAATPATTVAAPLHDVADDVTDEVGRAG
ncbi:MAG TPA: DUF2142 domain-containing protein, partial [Ilumatobacteraceae bacterium]